MHVSEAKGIAREWVVAEGTNVPGFCGAFYHGSTNWMADDDLLPATSDLDIMLVLADPDPSVKLGKFLYRDLLLEVSSIPQGQLRSPEEVLGTYHLAGSFQGPSVILDPTGQLTRLQAAVAEQYARRPWVVRRCADARDRVLRNLGGVAQPGPFHDQVMAWLFAAGVTTHVLLVAGLRNPTVRRRYEALRGLLPDYGRPEWYEEFLELLGCAGMSRARAMEHLAALEAAFDEASAIIKTPFFFAADLSDDGRRVAIDGSRELIERGEQREAIFWMVATSCRCQKVLAQDAPPALRERHSPAFRHLVADLGIETHADLQRKGEQVRAFLPRLWEMAEAIIDANPAVIA